MLQRLVAAHRLQRIRYTASRERELPALCSLTTHNYLLCALELSVLPFSGVLTWPGLQEAVHAVMKGLGVPARDVELLAAPQVKWLLRHKFFYCS